MIHKHRTHETKDLLRKNEKYVLQRIEFKKFALKVNPIRKENEINARALR